MTSKDAIIQHLVEMLDVLSDKIGSLRYKDFYCDECYSATLYSSKFYDKMQELKDYIWHRKIDALV